MEKPKRRLVERVIDPSFSSGLGGRELEELRSMREECREVENEISFERRLCQGRIDILTAELDRRTSGQGGDGDLLERLPQILGAETGRADGPLPSRAPDLSIPRNADIPRRRVEEIVGEQTLARLSVIQAEEVKTIIANLFEHERRLSERRKRVHDVMDAVQAELVRRYTSGEADPTAALR